MASAAVGVLVSLAFLVQVQFQVQGTTGIQIGKIKTRMICQGEKRTFKCSNQSEILLIFKAAYGRTEPGRKICPYNKDFVGNVENDTDDTNEGCIELDVKMKLRKLCQMKLACDVTVGTGSLGEHCQGTYKYLKVLFACAYVPPSEPGNKTLRNRTTAPPQPNVTDVTPTADLTNNATFSSNVTALYASVPGISTVYLIIFIVSAVVAVLFMVTLFGRWLFLKRRTKSQNFAVLHKPRQLNDVPKSPRSLKKQQNGQTRKVSLDLNLNDDIEEPLNRETDAPAVTLAEVASGNHAERKHLNAERPDEDKHSQNIDNSSFYINPMYDKQRNKGGPQVSDKRRLSGSPVAFDPRHHSESPRACDHHRQNGNPVVRGREEINGDSVMINQQYNGNPVIHEQQQYQSGIPVLQDQKRGGGPLMHDQQRGGGPVVYDHQHQWEIPVVYDPQYQTRIPGSSGPSGFCYDGTRNGSVTSRRRQDKRCHSVGNIPRGHNHYDGGRGGAHGKNNLQEVPPDGFHPLASYMPPSSQQNKHQYQQQYHLQQPQFPLTRDAMGSENTPQQFRRTQAISQSRPHSPLEHVRRDVTRANTRTRSMPRLNSRPRIHEGESNIEFNVASSRDTSPQQNRTGGYGSIPRQEKQNGDFQNCNIVNKEGEISAEARADDGSKPDFKSSFSRKMSRLF